MRDKGYTHSNIGTVNLKTFDIVLQPAFGMAHFTHSINILPSRRTRRRNKIRNVFEIKKPLI